MKNDLFQEFESISAKQWKQKIQMDLKGADYNKTLLWQSNENISIRPFYTKEDQKNQQINLPKNIFNICQTVFIDDETIANSLAVKALQRGANSIEFLANNPFNIKKTLNNIDIKITTIYFSFSFLSSNFMQEIAKFYNSKNIYFNTDIIGNLAKTGNWFTNLKSDYALLEKIVKITDNCINVNASIYQNAGANIVQQLAYTLAHANEYLNYFGKKITSKVHFKFSVGSNYFFEIAKLRAFRILWESHLKKQNIKNTTAHVFAQPTLRNKTLYDYNVNMLRTTSECMSCVFGGANTVANVAYDAVFRKSNEFGERISRNQLLILKEECEITNPQHIADGTYYIEEITRQLCEKALEVFKQIQSGGGFLKQLKEGIIQRKIKESANKEQTQFNSGELVLLGTNKLRNPNENINSLELYPFVKKRIEKTLIEPIIQKRLAEKMEQEQLSKA